ncbi:unnamed protein product [Mycena citricolor]|uniref:Uncharacterized protein n=1 Tax=Mycena citricolor TaxID=2018698 RepID=A0AAD2GZB7_9AGAR|nr:unnamed protein product [Mycena citricolor]
MSTTAYMPFLVSTPQQEWMSEEMRRGEFFPPPPTGSGQKNGSRGGSRQSSTPSTPNPEAVPREQRQDPVTQASVTHPQVGALLNPLSHSPLTQMSLPSNSTLSSSLSQLSPAKEQGSETMIPPSETSDSPRATRSASSIVESHTPISHAYPASWGAQSKAQAVKADVPVQSPLSDESREIDKTQTRSNVPQDSNASATTLHGSVASDSSAVAPSAAVAGSHVSDAELIGTADAPGLLDRTPVMSPSDTPDYISRGVVSSLSMDIPPRSASDHWRPETSQTPISVVQRASPKLLSTPNESVDLLQSPDASAQPQVLSSPQSIDSDQQMTSAEWATAANVDPFHVKSPTPQELSETQLSLMMPAPHQSLRTSSTLMTHSGHSNTGLVHSPGDAQVAADPATPSEAPMASEETQAHIASHGHPDMGLVQGAEDAQVVDPLDSSIASTNEGKNRPEQDVALVRSPGDLSDPLKASIARGGDGSMTDDHVLELNGSGHGTTNLPEDLSAGGLGDEAPAEGAVQPEVASSDRVFDRDAANAQTEKTRRKYQRFGNVGTTAEEGPCHNPQGLALWLTSYAETSDRTHPLNEAGMGLVQSPGDAQVTHPLGPPNDPEDEKQEHRRFDSGTGLVQSPGDAQVPDPLESTSHTLPKPLVRDVADTGLVQASQGAPGMSSGASQTRSDQALELGRHDHGMTILGQRLSSQDPRDETQRQDDVQPGSTVSPTTPPVRPAPDAVDSTNSKYQRASEANVSADRVDGWAEQGALLFSGYDGIADQSSDTSSMLPNTPPINSLPSGIAEHLQDREGTTPAVSSGVPDTAPSDSLLPAVAGRLHQLGEETNDEKKPTSADDPPPPAKHVTTIGPDHPVSHGDHSATAEHAQGPVAEAAATQDQPRQPRSRPRSPPPPPKSLKDRIVQKIKDTVHH